MTAMHKPEDRHEWVGAIRTVIGEEFDIADPKAVQVDIDVVAHSLALQCRYIGHVPFPYSVAEHSVRVSRWVEEQGGSIVDQQKGLWHDGPEAFCGDMVRPMKRMDPLGPAYLEVEEKIAWAVSDAVGLDLVDLPQIVMDGDKAMFEWETANIRTGRTHGWSWYFAREAFLRRHELLFNETIWRFWQADGYPATLVSPHVGQ
jgi:hypothetical protein